MLIEAPQTTIETNIPQDNNTAFSLELNAITFDILSSNLYKDPITAIVRELSCNALDSHKRAGNEQTPFEVTVPTHHSPTFNIRDYGTGLTPQQMQHLYTRYFSSDKRDSNNEIGGKGLGSKTPLAYKNTFNVSNYKDGTVYHYIVYKNEKGIPHLTLLKSMPTDEPNGLKITLAVNPTDIDKFTDAADSVLRWMHVKPINWDLKKPTLAIDHSAWSLYIDSDLGNTTHLMMGNVLYPIPKNITDPPFSLLRFSHISAVLKCEIGEVDVTAGRDSLQRTKKTLTTLKRLHQEFLNSYAECVSRYISTEPTRLKAIKKLWELTSNNRIRHSDIVTHGIVYTNPFTQERYELDDNYSNLIVQVPQDGLVFCVDPTRNWRNPSIRKVTEIKLSVLGRINYSHTTTPTKYATQIREVMALCNSALTYILVSKDPATIDAFYRLVETDTPIDLTERFNKAPKKEPKKPKPTVFSLFNTVKGPYDATELPQTDLVAIPVSEKQQIFIDPKTHRLIPLPELYKHLTALDGNTADTQFVLVPNKRIADKLPKETIELEAYVRAKLPEKLFALPTETYARHMALYQFTYRVTPPLSLVNMATFFGNIYKFDTEYYNHIPGVYTIEQEKRELTKLLTAHVEQNTTTPQHPGAQ